MVKKAHQLLSAKVYHKRLKPRENAFCYRTFYTVLDMQKLNEHNNGFFSMSKISLLNYQHRDHGNRDGSDATAWAKQHFLENNLMVDKIMLITMPRILGYLFNPVSFWLGYIQNKLCGVICEVNNTFQQTHSYICYKENSEEIFKEDSFYAPKEFHVSPFYPLKGAYYFKFDLNATNNNYAISINYHIDSQLEMITSVKGIVKPMTNRQILIEFFRAPLLTFKVIALIHYQALKLFIKKSIFHRLPQKNTQRITRAYNIKKN
jgi:DUF1365 family protein